MTDEDKNRRLDYDFFEGEDVPDEKEKPESPEEREERELDEIVVISPRDHYRDLVLAIVTGAVVLLSIIVWWLFYHPVVTDAQVTGRLMSVRCEGAVFKTFEAGMVSEQYVTDEIKRQDNDFVFSIENDSLAYQLMKLQNTGKRIVLKYKQYNAALPWRGNSDIIATELVEE